MKNYLHGSADKDRLEDLAKRVAAEINERAARMTAEDREKADSETKKIADQVQRRARLPNSS